VPLLAGTHETSVSRRRRRVSDPPRIAAHRNEVPAFDAGLTESQLVSAFRNKSVRARSSVADLDWLGPPQ
jgi:hypothetical protein